MRRWRELRDAEQGSASLEFITAGLLLLVPLVYLVLVLSSLQAAALATEGAARQGARVFASAPDRAAASVALDRAIAVGLADYGLEASEVRVSCAPEPRDCLTRRGYVSVTIAVRVALPLSPRGLSLAVPASMPVESTATQQVSRFWRATG